MLHAVDTNLSECTLPAGLRLAEEEGGQQDLGEARLQEWLEFLLILGHVEREALDDLGVQNAHRPRLGLVVIHSQQGIGVL